VFETKNHMKKGVEVSYRGVTKYKLNPGGGRELREEREKEKI